MLMNKTGYFELVDDKDLQTQKSYDGMIMYCENTKCFASQKACGGRTIFPSNTIYHPTDGNCVIAEIDRKHKDVQIAYERRWSGIEGESDFKRINTVKDLEVCINHYNNKI